MNTETKETKAKGAAKKAPPVKKRTTKRPAKLTHVQSHAVINYLLARKDHDQKIDIWVGKLAEECSLAVGFEVSKASVAHLCKELNIETRNRGENGAVHTEPSEEYKMLLHQFSRVERKVNRLLKEMDVKFDEI